MSISSSTLTTLSISAASTKISQRQRRPKRPRVDFDKTETVGSTRWMRLETLSYHVPIQSGQGGDANIVTLRKWDRAVRTTKQSENSIDAVVILAILKNDVNDPTKDEIVCVKQFRPPVDAYTIELPAGLIDPNEDPGVAAEREFTEETGYIGKVVDVLPASYLSPGLTNESASFVRLEVDMTLERNIQIRNNHHIENSLLESSEKDRGSEKILLPRIGLLEALHDMEERGDVKVFAALYSLALGMSVGEGVAVGGPSGMKKYGSRVIEQPPSAMNIEQPPSTNNSANIDIPLVELKLDGNHNPTAATSHAVTSALRGSGFLLINTPILPLELQKRALNAASQFLGSSSSKKVVTHPSDPKVYAMLQGVGSVSDNSIDSAIINDLKEWYYSMRKVKAVLLHCIAIGLGMSDDANFFVELHDEDHDAVCLLKYPPGNAITANRCKEHSDCGTLTLLLNDGVGGLEAYVDGDWKPIPYVEGSIVVNIGSVLSEWTQQELKATLHRVAGPMSKRSSTPKDDLLKAVAAPRISIVYFADPNGDAFD